MSNPQIVRRPDFAGGGITDTEKEMLAPHSRKWIERALRTKPIEPEKIIPAIKGLYAAAGLPEPRVIIVPSPLVMAMAGGISSLWWHLRDKKYPLPTRAAIDAAIDAATRAATYAATRAAIDAATYAATYAATRAATRAAIDAAIDAATRAATYAATDAATRAAIDAATYAATYAAIDAATKNQNWTQIASEFVGEKWALTAMECAYRWDVCYQGGNMWAAWDCYLTAFRDVLGLKLSEHEKYQYWEEAAIHGGFRWMHPQFCFVSDFPEILKIDSQNRPHAEFGPSHRWRDGWSIYHLHGVRVEDWMAEDHPDDIDPRKVLQIENVDQRREVIRRLGSERLVEKLDARVLDTETRVVGGKYDLLEIDMKQGEPWKFLKMQNQSIDAVHVEAVPRECLTIRHAINWRASQNIEEDWVPTELS